MEQKATYLTQQRLTARENYICFDIETVGREDAVKFVGEPEAPSNYKDAEKIAAYIAEKRVSQLEKLALDMNLNKIVSLGVKTSQMETPMVYPCKNDDDERVALTVLWTLFYSDLTQKHPLIGFHCKGFDVPVCIRRTQLLGLPAPALDTAKYSKDVIDLADELAFGKYQESGVMPRTLKMYCDLFGVTQYDDGDGSDIAAMYAAGDWDGIVKHNAADVMRTEELAVRLGVI